MKLSLDILTPLTSFCAKKGIIKVNEFSISSSFSVLLDIARWLAALLVMVGHLRDIIFTSYENVIHCNQIVRFFYFITGFSHYAVIIFFVLSGLLVGGSVLRQYHDNNFRWGSYLVKRVTRIYIVFIFALFFGATFDLLGLNSYNQLGLYDNSHNLEFHSVLTELNIGQSLNPSVFLGNIFMLQTIKVPVLGSNGPLWSLANEFWYYILFPIILSFLKSDSLHKKFFFLVIGGTLLFLLPANILVYFGIWILGALLRVVKLPACSNPYWSFFLLLLCLALIRVFCKDAVVFDFVLAFVFCFFLSSFYLFEKKQINTKKLSNHAEIHRFLANFSYSLYATHFPFLLFLISFTNFHFGMKIDIQPSVKSFAVFFLAMILTYFFAFIVSIITERNTKIVRDYTFSVLKKFNLR